LDHTYEKHYQVFIKTKHWVFWKLIKVYNNNLSGGQWTVYS